MARRPTWPLTFEDAEQRARWEKVADERGHGSLAQYVRAAVERDIALGPPTIEQDAIARVSLGETVHVAGKKSYAADPKGGGRPK